MPLRDGPVGVISSVTVYHLHARLFEGNLAAPIRDETEIHDVHTLGEARIIAKGLAARGFTVWIYDHGHRPGVPGASNYRGVAKYLPDGLVDDDVVDDLDGGGRGCGSSR